MDIGYGTLPASGSNVVVRLNDFPISKDGDGGVATHRAVLGHVHSVVGHDGVSAGAGIDIVTHR